MDECEVWMVDGVVWMVDGVVWMVDGVVWMSVVWVDEWGCGWVGCDGCVDRMLVWMDLWCAVHLTCCLYGGCKW